MSSIEYRASVQEAWRNWHKIESRSRGADKWQACTDHPSTWDWQECNYRDAGKSVVHKLFDEVKQACKDGEGVILSQKDGKAIVKALKAR